VIVIAETSSGRRLLGWGVLLNDRLIGTGVITRN